MREDLARFFSIPKKAENVPKIYLGDIFRFFWGQIKYFPFLKFGEKKVAELEMNQICLSSIFFIKSIVILLLDN